MDPAAQEVILSEDSGSRRARALDHRGINDASKLLLVYGMRIALIILGGIWLLGSVIGMSFLERVFVIGVTFIALFLMSWIMRVSPYVEYAFKSRWTLKESLLIARGRKWGKVKYSDISHFFVEDVKSDRNYFRVVVECRKIATLDLVLNRVTWDPDEVVTLLGFRVKSSQAV